MGLELAHGGHLTHGMKLNVSGRRYNIAPYQVHRETSLIDMDEVQRVALERRPKMILAGWSAYPRQLDFERFRAIADEVGRTWSWTWLISPVSWPRACIPARSLLPTW